METPKHLIAMARSKNRAALGYVILEQAKKEDCLPTLAATFVRRSNPNPEARAESPMRRTPSPNPTPDRAAGMASIPEPRMVFVTFKLEETTVPVGAISALSMTIDESCSDPSSSS
jgi:hypothetical protein